MRGVPNQKRSLSIALRCLLGENPKEGSLLARVPPAVPAGSNKRTDSRYWVISLVAGILLALLIAAEELLAT